MWLYDRTSFGQKQTNFERKVQTSEAQRQVLMTSQRAAVATMWTTQEPSRLEPKKRIFHHPMAPSKPYEGMLKLLRDISANLTY